MIIRRILVLLLLSLLSVVQVGAHQMSDSVTTISLNAMAGLQFNLVRFKVKPGEKVKIIYANMDDMSHNLLIIKPGTRLDVVNAALKLEEKGPLMNYIPTSSKVLWSIPVLSPEQTKSITFTAPLQTGAYPYVCTYPGHGFVMYGAMYVTSDGEMPDIKSDTNVPPAKRKEGNNVEIGKNDNMHAGHHAEENSEPPAHPYALVPPYLYRTFMEDASPAAIAVSLPQNLSYCWDTSLCRLRYAWAGGFIDNTPIWKGHSDAVAKIIGTIFYREASYPLQIGKSEDVPVLEYKGYRLINNYPEFHYTLNGTDVYELILPKEDGNGLIRNFRIPNAKTTVWFISNISDKAVSYEVSAGKWNKGKLELTPQLAKKFMVTMTSYPLVYTRKKK